MQFPKELQLGLLALRGLAALTSMKCSSRRNCNRRQCTGPCIPADLNEVQFPKELQRGVGAAAGAAVHTSMKCSSRRNCNVDARGMDSLRWHLNEVQLSKELQHRGCRPCPYGSAYLNEVQFPKELQPDRTGVRGLRGVTSMKCSSRRNCNVSPAA